MLKNYLKTLLRTLRKNKLATIINIVGLTVAFCCATLLLLRVYHEFSFDRFFENKGKLYELYKFTNRPEGEYLSNSIAFPAQEALKKENIGVEKAAIYKQGGTAIRTGEKELSTPVELVGSEFLQLFSFPVQKGNRQTALSSPNSIVLTRDMAENLFPAQEAVGQQLQVNIDGKWLPLQVSAVLENLPKNSSFRFGALANIELDPNYSIGKDQWNMSSARLFVALDAHTSKEQFERRVRDFVGKQVTEETISYFKGLGYRKDVNGDYTGMRLLPITQMHFTPGIGDDDAVSKPFLYVLFIIACVILLIACFNFMNLSIGSSFTRVKEIGVRKCLGALKSQVCLQVWSESIGLILVALVLGIVLAITLTGTFNQLFGGEIKAAMLLHPAVIAGALLLILLISVIASGYPSLLLARLKTPEVLKGKLNVGRQGGLRTASIVLQFVIAVVLICATCIIYLQFQHLRKAPLGYQTESLISVPIRDERSGHQVVDKMRILLRNQTAFEGVTGTNINLGVGTDGASNKESMGFEFNGKAIKTNLLNVDYDFIKTVGLPLKAGRDFSPDFVADTASGVIVTESVLKQLQLEEPVIGRQIVHDSAHAPWTIVGVIPDFNLYSVNKQKEPLVICLGVRNPLSYILVKINTNNPAGAMDLVKDAYKQAAPGAEFNGSFVSENVARWYHNEKRLAKMFTIAAVVAIVLSCMGLFGMAFIVVGQRTKEIGVRKVLGASVSSIAALISKEFIKPVIIAIVIAIPIALWALNKWLQHFTYRVSLTWWVFAAAGTMALVIAVLTVGMQAIKAAVANPVNSLRDE